MSETSPEAHDAPDTDAADADTSDDAARASGRRRDRRARKGGGWLEYVITMAVALVVAVLVKTFLIQPFYIPSASMEPTLMTNDRILVSKLSPTPFELERGDLIVFEDPGDWIPGSALDDPGIRTRVMQALSWVGLAPDPGDNHLVKRLIGLPGDRVVCESEGAQLQVNGVPVTEPYINPQAPACQVPFDVTVPEGDVWVMGDNRYNSADSALHEYQGEEAFVPQDDITGKAVVIMWPIGNWSGLGGGEDAFTDVPDAPLAS